MKKLFGLGIVVMACCMLACGNGEKKAGSVEPTAEQTIKKREFQLPEVPVMLDTPEQRAAYVARHYWDHFDFQDTAYIHLPDITEQAAVNFMDLLTRVPSDEASASLLALVQKASVEPLMMNYFWKTLFRYWHEPNSPMKNEDLFILFCREVEQHAPVGLALQERAAFLRRMAEKNRVGMSAADFVYTLPSGKQGRMYGIKAEFTLLFFYNPDCETCAAIKQAMRSSLLLHELTDSKRMKVLTIYPDEDVELWRAHLNEMEDSWINGYDKGQVLTMEQLYDLTSIPSFYLLDKNKKVLLKDADWQQVLYFFGK